MDSLAYDDPGLKPGEREKSMNWFERLPELAQIGITLSAIIVFWVIIVSATVHKEKKSRQYEHYDLPEAHNIVPRIQVNPSHDAEPTATYAEDADTEACDIPDLIPVTQPVLLTKEERLEAANANRKATAQVKVESAAMDILAGSDKAEVAEKYGYKNVRCLRVAMNRYGYSLTGKKLERKGVEANA